MPHYDVGCFSKITDYSHQEIFLDTFLPDMNWDTKANVIDIGSGPGSVSVDVLWPRLKQYGARSLTCMDSISDMVSWSKRNYDQPGVSFHQADIGNIDSIPSEWIGKFDKAFSFYVLQALPNFEKAFRNIGKLLKTSGEIAFMFVLRAPQAKVQMTMLKNEKWRNVLMAGEDISLSCVDKVYRDADFNCSLITMLNQCGFEPKSIKDFTGDRYFQNAKDFTEFVLAIDPLKKKIPEHMLEEYTSDMYDEFVKIPYLGQEGNRSIIDPSDGSHVFYSREIFLHAVKV
ncbi:Uncharacterised protein g9945 [Pycnogonum litorale]